MFRSTSLSPSHYAGKWRVPGEEQLNDLSQVNQLGIEYAKLKDCPRKEDKLLQIIQCFHGYLMKYVSMVVRGTLPPLTSASGRDAKMMLTTLIPRKTKVSRATLTQACKMLHLAFKGMTTEEIYDTLAFCLMRAARKYDPYYTDKMRSVCEAINDLPSQFAPADLDARMGYDCHGFLRVLVRKGFLTSIAGKRKKIVAYKRASAWPPQPQFFQSGPIGFTYCIQMWFRYYLHEFINTRMSEVESIEGFMQLEHRTPDYGRHFDRVFGGHWSMEEIGLPHEDGNCVTSEGFRFMADTTLMDLPLDVSEMTMEWVQYTEDKLFRNLTRRERLILYLLLVEEKNWKQIAKTLGCDTQTVKRRVGEIIEYLSARMLKGNREQARRNAEQFLESLKVQPKPKAKAS